MVQYLAPITVFVSSWVERETESKNLDGLVNYKVKHEYLDIVARKLSDFSVCLFGAYLLLFQNISRSQFIRISSL